jgi:hypothetical protein
MKGARLLIGILLFGSLWGAAECLLGDSLRDLGLPAGMPMTAIAIFLMMSSRKLYHRKGMQMGMALVAGTLRIFNPFGSCLFCSAIAIIAEGAVFEALFLMPFFNALGTEDISSKLSAGVLLGFVPYSAGYVVTQVLTPFLTSANFYLSDLLALLPRIVSQGAIAGVLTAIVLPVAIYVGQLELNLARRELYYPAASVVSIACWLMVLAV